MEKEHDQTECLEFEIKIVWRGHHHLGPCWKFSSFCRKCMFKNRMKHNWLFPCSLKFLPYVLLLISHTLFTTHYCYLFFHVSQAASSEGRYGTSTYLSQCLALFLAITYSQQLFSFLLLYSETFTDSPLSLKVVLRFFSGYMCLSVN